MHEHIRQSMSKFQNNALTDNEKQDYIPYNDEQIYFVRHIPEGEVLGRVLLAGPIAWHRSGPTYPILVRWARYLAERGFETMRFDYRGCGESTGDFSKLSFKDWQQDIHTCVDYLSEGGSENPLILHGVEVGATLCAHALSEGYGDHLLMWSPIVSGEELLFKLLRLKLASDFIYSNKGKRKERKDYVNDLENGVNVDVKGYPITPQLWQSAKAFRLPPNLTEDTVIEAVQQSKIISLTKKEGPLYTGLDDTKTQSTYNSRKPVPFLINLDEFFKSNVQWISSLPARVNG